MRVRLNCSRKSAALNEISLTQTGPSLAFHARPRTMCDHKFTDARLFRALTRVPSPSPSPSALRARRRVCLRFGSAAGLGLTFRKEHI